MAITLSGCGMLPKERVEVEVPRNVYIEVPKPVYVPESLLVACEQDPKLSGEKISNEKVAVQSLERKARLERCSEKVEGIRKYNDTMRQDYSNDSQETDLVE